MFSNGCRLLSLLRKKLRSVKTICLKALFSYFVLTNKLMLYLPRKSSAQDFTFWKVDFDDALFAEVPLLARLDDEEDGGKVDVDM